MHKIFIDGHVGTTGLLIHQRLKQRDDIELLSIADADRKRPSAKQQVMAEADLVILCLPDAAARETVNLAPPATRIIDASTAHRTDSRWVYGLPELAACHRDVLTDAHLVSVPGCWATAFVLTAAPLRSAGLISPSAQLAVNGVSGYSGGGRKMIERYEARVADNPNGLWQSRPYALNLSHKHLPEMQHYAGLDYAPIFQPSVGHFHQGMLVGIPLLRSLLPESTSAADIHGCIAECYGSEPCIVVHPLNDEKGLEQGFLNPQANNGTNRLDVFVWGHEDQILVTTILDNLGKGASGATVQNLNLMLGVDEFRGLTL